MSTPIIGSHAFAQPTCDPGAEYTLTQAHDATRSLHVAVEHTVISGLADSLRLALQGAKAIEALMDEQFGRHLASTPRTPHQLSVDLTRTALTTGVPPTLNALTEDAYAAWLARTREEAVSEVFNVTRSKIGNALAEQITTVLPDCLTAIRAHVGTIMEQTRTASKVIEGVDRSDVASVAEASTAQRKAIAALSGLARDYNRARLLQRNLMVASSLLPLGVTPHSATVGAMAWVEVINSGVTEFARITRVDHGPDASMESVTRLLAVAARPDVWVPDMDEAEDRYTELYPPLSGGAMNAGPVTGAGQVA